MPPIEHRIIASGIGLQIFRTLSDPFASGQPLEGFRRLNRKELGSRRALALRARLTVRSSQLPLFELGVLPDGRWAVVGCTKKYLRGAIEIDPCIPRRVRRWGHISEIVPLPESETRAILVRLVRGLSEDELLGSTTPRG